MKVKELVKLLTAKSIDQDSEVILQRDSEGNGYSPLCGVDGKCVYIDGEVHSTKSSANDVCMDEDEWENIKKSNKRCVVLWPI